MVSAFTVVPGQTLALDAPADIRLSQAALNDVLVDQKRSSLKLTYWSGLDPDVPDDDEEEVDLEQEDKKYTINIANFIPGAVSILPSIPSLCENTNNVLSSLRCVPFPFFECFLLEQVETQSFGGLIINSGERVTFEATGKKYDTSFYHSSTLLRAFLTIHCCLLCWNSLQYYSH
jgi:hypothetical protein